MDEKNETGPAVEPKQEQQCKQARPHDELICELLDSRRPKTEREHAAVREIERLRHDIDRHSAIASEYATECERLRAELAAVRRVLNHAVAMAMDCDPELPHYLDRAEEHIDAARKGEEKP